MKGSIMQIQNFSVNDGNGIRTTIFLAGCPLHCQWCANPEGMTISTKIAYYQRHCTSCGRCEKHCPSSIGIDLNLHRSQCTSCGACTTVCPTGARKFLVEQHTIQEILDAVKPQIPFFRQSKGGVTFSGGEATLQEDFFRELAVKLYDMGIDLALETCGYFDFDAVKDILSLMDLIFIDIKTMNSQIHKQYTGIGNEKILQNIVRMRELNAQIIVRIPVIGGVNADDENIQHTAAFVKEALPGASIELLPYHCYGEAKYEALGLPLPSAAFQTPDAQRMEQLEGFIQAAGVPTIRFR